MATDPVCGMYVDERGAELRVVRDNRAYYFCSRGCLDTFVAPARHLQRLRHRLAVAWPAAIAVVLLTYAFHFAAAPYVAFVLATVVQFYPGLDFYQGFADAVRNRTANMDVLIATGTTAAYAYSVAVLFVPTSLSPQYFFDASSLIVTLILTGNYLEVLTRARANSELNRLGELLPAYVHRLSAPNTDEVPLAQLRAGDRIQVRPGERIPGDGVIVSGRSDVDTSLVTGELTPQPRRPGDAVLAGELNGSGVLDVQVRHAGADTFLSHLQALMSDAELNQVPVQRLADRLAASFVPVVLVLAVVASSAWYVFGGASSTVAVLIFVSVVITACPCAFGIATPAAVIVATGRAAENGVLFKGRDAIERTATVQMVVLDKTGTLTLGQPRLTEVVSASGWEEAEILRLAAAIESGSEHPLASAVLEAARARSVSIPPATDITALPGLGIRGRVAGRLVEVLADPVASPGGGVPSTLSVAAERVQASGMTASSVIVDGDPVGLFAFEDPLRPEAVAAVSELSDLGLTTALVSGDQAAAVARAAETTGISLVRASVPPDQKVSVLQSFQASGRRVAFVGDGLNDAPALVAADAGIALGTGADITKEAGKVILIRADLRGVPFALRTARRTLAKIRQNLLWAVGYNAVLLPIAAGVLVPWLGFSIYAFLPVLGALAMGISSTTVVLNSFSLRRIPWDGRRTTRTEPARSAAPA